MVNPTDFNIGLTFEISSAKLVHNDLISNNPQHRVIDLHRYKFSTDTVDNIKSRWTPLQKEIWSETVSSTLVFYWKLGAHNIWERYPLHPNPPQIVQKISQQENESPPKDVQLKVIPQNSITSSSQASQTDQQNMIKQMVATEIDLMLNNSELTKSVES